MRMMLKTRIPAAKGSQTLKDGSMQKVIEETIAKLKPEAAYFAIQDGQRCAFFFFEMSDTSDVVSVCEPMWMNFDAEVELTPVMNADDLAAGLQKAFG